MQADSLKTFFAVVASVVTILGSGYTLSDKIGFKWTRPVLTWAPEHFTISDGPLDGTFRIVVAREKHRDDCDANGFSISIRDSNLEVFSVTPSSSIFEGPASNNIDKFAYNFYIREHDYDNISTGKSTFMGTIKYSCPEGDQRMVYPPDLYFTIEDPNDLKD